MSNRMSHRQFEGRTESSYLGSIGTVLFLIGLIGSPLTLAVEVKPFTVPKAGTDVTVITLIEEYDIEGVGKDTVQLTGRLVAERGSPLLDPGTKKVDWKTSTIVAKFTSLELEGNSKVFGPVKVTLDERFPAFGVVTDGKCRASISVKVEMTKLGETFRTTEPVQLFSQVKTVPPIGDEKTVSLEPVAMMDRAGKIRGRLNRAQIIWRELVEQKAIQ